MHYVMIKSTSNTESGYYFLHSEDDEIKDLLLEICMNAVESASDFEISDIDTLIKKIREDEEVFEGYYYFDDLVALYEGDDVLSHFSFHVGSMENSVRCYTDDPSKFIEYLKTIDKDLIEGMDADEAGKAIANEYTTW